MIKFINRLLFALTFFTTSIFSLISATVTDPPPNPGDGTGGGGTGRPASPIDGEIWILIAISVILIAVFAMRYRKKLITN